jgi:hypothetical protein
MMLIMEVLAWIPPRGTIVSFAAFPGRDPIGALCPNPTVAVILERQNITEFKCTAKVHLHEADVGHVHTALDSMAAVFLRQHIGCLAPAHVRQRWSSMALPIHHDPVPPHRRKKR